ncbi:MAG: pseudouridine synthase [Bacteroidota bacterium]
MPKPPKKNNRFNKRKLPRPPKPGAKRPSPPSPEPPEAEDGSMRLNKYIAHCGIASRRKASELIQQGLVTVNGEVVLEMGHRVQPDDVVTFKGEVVKPEENKVYLLLNKPKNTITTVTDDRGRPTVMDLVGDAVKERIFPVGRLDRATTGLLLLTNDGALAKKLSHPSHGVKKVYHVVLDREVSKEHIKAIAAGLTLEDGLAPVDGVSHVKGSTKNEVGIEVHIGRNRIVRRIFEHLGYKVKRLDRVYYAGLTKKDLPRSRFRFLTEREIIMLKHFT